MNDWIAELGKATEEYNIYLTKAKEVHSDFEREMKIAEESLGHGTKDYNEHVLWLRKSRKYKRHVEQLDILTRKVAEAQYYVKYGGLGKGPGDDPFWWSQLDDAHRHNPEHMATKGTIVSMDNKNRNSKKRGRVIEVKRSQSKL